MTIFAPGQPSTFVDESDAMSDASWNGPTGSRVRYSMSALWDGIADGAIYAAQVGLVTLAPYDALPWASKDRQIVQGFQEGIASFVARMVQWLDRWPYSGRQTGVLLAMRGWILPQMPQIAVVTDRATWWGYAAGVDPMPAGANTVTPATITVEAPGTWDWDYPSALAATVGAFWSRSWPIIWSTGVPWCVREANTWGTGTWGDGNAWGFENPSSSFNGLTTSVSQWKAKHDLVPAIIVSFDNTWYQATSIAAKLPDGTWGNWHKVVNGVAVAARDQTVSRFLTGAS